MIILVMLLLKMEVVEEVDLEILTFLIISLIFLKTFLVKALVEAVDQEGRIKEDLILDMIYLYLWRKPFLVRNKI